MTPTALAGSVTLAVVGIDLGNALIISVAVIVGIFTLVRGRADVWKSNYEAERDRADRVQKELDSCRLEVSDQRQKLAKLEAVPSIEKLYEIMTGHNTAEQVIWDKVVKALDTITTKLTEGAP